MDLGLFPNDFDDGTILRIVFYLYLYVRLDEIFPLAQ